MYPLTSDPPSLGCWVGKSIGIIALTSDPPSLGCWVGKSIGIIALTSDPPSLGCWVGKSIGISVMIYSFVDLAANVDDLIGLHNLSILHKRINPDYRWPTPETTKTPGMGWHLQYIGYSRACAVHSSSLPKEIGNFPSSSPLPSLHSRHPQSVKQGTPSLSSIPSIVKSLHSGQ